MQDVAERRAALGLSQQRAAKKAGIGRSTWIHVEVGDRPAEDYILAAVSRALDWTTGSAAAILAGGQPTPAPQEAAVEPATEAPRRTPLDPDLLRIARILADPDADPVAVRLLKAQLRTWADTVEAGQPVVRREEQRRREAI
jgi:DNA-binding XRE family transcriptional regulator